MPEVLEGDCHARRQRGRGAWGPRERVSNAHGKRNSPNVLDGLPAGRETQTGRRARPDRPLVPAATGDAQTAGPAVPLRQRRRAQESGARAMRDIEREATWGGGAGGESRRGTSAGEEGGPAGKTAISTRTLRRRSQTRRRMKRLCKITNNAHLAARTMRYFPLDPRTSL